VLPFSPSKFSRFPRQYLCRRISQIGCRQRWTLLYGLAPFFQVSDSLSALLGKHVSKDQASSKIHCQHNEFELTISFLVTTGRQEPPFFRTRDDILSSSLPEVWKIRLDTPTSFHPFPRLPFELRTNILSSVWIRSWSLVVHLRLCPP
jgi:hypothetical protein